MTKHFLSFCGIILMLSSSMRGIEISNDTAEFLLDPTIIPLQLPVKVVNQEFDCEPLNEVVTQNIINLLTPPVEGFGIDILPILREDIYKSTVGPVTRRSLLDMPAMTPDFFDSECPWLLTADFFYNFSPKVFFTKNSAFLSSYIDLNNQNIINTVANSIFPSVDVPGLFGLFSTIKLQQYRAGIMMAIARHWDCWTVTARIPLYYLLENFFLNDQEVSQIQNNPFFRDDDGGIGDTPAEEVRKFALRHLVQDRIGIGDSRITLLLKTHCTDNFKAWFGLQATIPTARDIKRGLIAGEFEPIQSMPIINLQSLANIFFCNPNQTFADETLRRILLEEFLVDTLDRLSTILITTPLGNGKHFGLGPEIDAKWYLNEYFSMQTYASLQAYTPHRENRFYLMEKTDEDFDRDWRDTSITGDNLVTLNRLIVQTLYPVGVRTTIHPGIRFQCNHSFLYKSEHWNLAVGFDYWYFGEETQQLLLPVVPFNKRLVQQKGQRPAAHQGKIITAIGYFHNGDCYDWYIDFNADATVFNTGIGRNYTVGFRLGLEF